MNKNVILFGPLHNTDDKTFLQNLQNAKTKQSVCHNFHVSFIESIIVVVVFFFFLYRQQLLSIHVHLTIAHTVVKCKNFNWISLLLFHVHKMFFNKTDVILNDQVFKTWPNLFDIIVI